MNNFIFLIVFVALLYWNIKHFLRIIENKEESRERGFFNPLYFSRFLFLCGVPILGFFIYDIFKVQMIADPSFLWLGGLGVVLTWFILYTLDKKVLSARKKKTEKNQDMK